MVARREIGSGRPRLFEFEKVGRLPTERDNVAIASRRLEAGDRVMFEGRELVLDSTILEGHRFAVRAIFKGGGATLLGLAVRAGDPGHRGGWLHLQRGDARGLG